MAGDPAMRTLKRMGWMRSMLAVAASAACWFGCSVSSGSREGIRAEPGADGGAIVSVDGSAPVTADASAADGAAPADGGTAPKPGGGATYAVACSKATVSGWYMAEQAFPGKTAVQLSKVRVLYPVDPATAQYYPGYSVTAGLPAVRDGSVAAVCNRTGVTVTFIEPDEW